MTEGEPETTETAAVRRAMREFLSSKGDSYQRVAEATEVLQAALREEAASAIRQPLNDEASHRPQATYEEKKALAAWINTELRRKGLTLRCPKTGKPTIIRACVGPDATVGKFRLDYIDDVGKHHYPCTSATLPTLDPVPDSIDHTPYRRRDGRGRGER